MQSGVQSYFAVLQAQDVIAQKQAEIITNPYMSIGTFGTGLSTQYRFGLALSTKPKGVIMDIDRILKQTVDKDNVRAKVTAYNRATGPSMSLNENLIPEQLFDDPNTKEKEAQGISAVKALQIASSQGQTIYTVTKANYAEILPKLNHSTDVMTDVRNAINAGKEVTISQTQVHAFGWSGTGYIVLDPESGVGAYLIGGGADGGWTQEQAGYASGLSAGIAISGMLIAFDGLSAITADPLVTPILTTFVILPFLIGNLIGILISGTLFGWSDLAYSCYLAGLVNGLALSSLGFMWGSRFSGGIGALMALLNIYMFHDETLPVASACGVNI